MKLLKLISVFAVIGIGLWGGLAQAQSQQSRTMQLCSFFSDDCGGFGQVNFNLWQIGSSASAGKPIPEIPADGDPHPVVSFNVSLPCQSPGTLGDDTDGPERFYGLYIQLDGGTPMRIFSFNTSCVSWSFHTEVRLPDIGDPNVWFTAPITVTIALEYDDSLDTSYYPILVSYD